MLEPDLLRKAFGLFLLVIGLRELLCCLFPVSKVFSKQGIKPSCLSKIQSGNYLTSMKGMVTPWVMDLQNSSPARDFILLWRLCLEVPVLRPWVAVDKTIDNIESAPLSETPAGRNHAPRRSARHTSWRSRKSTIFCSRPRVFRFCDCGSKRRFLPHPLRDSRKVSLTAETPDDESSTDVLSPSVPSESVPESTESSRSITQPVQRKRNRTIFPWPYRSAGAAIAPFSGDMLVKNETRWLAHPQRNWYQRRTRLGSHCIQWWC